MAAASALQRLARVGGVDVGRRGLGRIAIRSAAGGGGRRSAQQRRFASASPSSWSDGGAIDHDDDAPSLTRLFNPTDDHAALRDMVRQFAQREVEPQAIEHNRTETFNHELFRKFGSADGGLGVLGLTVPEEYGGTGLSDATAVSIVHEELSYSDPALCLSYLAHSVLLANNLSVNGSDEQLSRFMPGVCDGSKIGGMCMSEPNAGEYYMMCQR